MNNKLIYDPIHGYINFSNLCLKIIDTPEFQRLRQVKQLGICYLVFPGASHNRFEHSLGVAYLARELIMNLRFHQPELNINNKTISCVEIAGLCHDLGHGPFSHIFDNKFVKNFSNINYKHHEQRSCLIFEHIVKKYNIDLTENDCNMIKELIYPQKNNITPRFLYNIVSNIDNGIDVDKFDYIKRDSYNIGLSFNFDYDRILKQAKVIDDEIVYPSKIVFQLYELYRIRYQLHLQIYTHPVVRAIEFMIIDCLEYSDKILKISDRVDNPELFTTLNDSILDIIEFLSDDQLEKVKIILKNIKMRNLYNYIGEIILNEDDNNDYNYDTLIDMEFNLELISPRDIILDRVFLGCNDDPISKAKFYDVATNQIVNNHKRDVSKLLPEKFSETRLRFYCRNGEKKTLVGELFEDFKIKYNAKKNDDLYH